MLMCETTCLSWIFFLGGCTRLEETKRCVFCITSALWFCQFFVDYHSGVVEKTWHDLWMNIGANQDNQVMRLFDTVDG